MSRSRVPAAALLALMAARASAQQTEHAAGVRAAKKPAVPAAAGDR